MRVMPRRMTRIAVGAAVCLLAFWPASSLGAEVQPLTLYQRAGRSPWIVLGEVIEGDDRFIQVKLLRVLKGTYDQPTLRVVHRLENFLRESWEEKLDFQDGEMVCLFLKRYEGDREDGKVPEKLAAPDVFSSAFGAMGKFTLQEEGRAAYLDAIEAFIRVTGITDSLAQDEALIAFLVSENPHVLQAGLEQVLERRTATDKEADTLLRLADHEREPIRLYALQAMRQVAEDLAAAGRALPDQSDVVNRLKAKVLGSGSEVYRAEAVRVVAALAGKEERDFLGRISKDDASQLVRYEASSALMELDD